MINAQEKLEKALADYQDSNGADVNAGFNILRYVEQGRLYWETEDFVALGVPSIKIAILRLAKTNKLKIRLLKTDVKN